MLQKHRGRYLKETVLRGNVISRKKLKKKPDMQIQEPWKNVHSQKKKNPSQNLLILFIASYVKKSTGMFLLPRSF